MRFSLAATLVVTLAAEAAVANSWFSTAVYNKWHETELERWLSDHDIPHPTPADRADLQNLVKANWQSAVESPYASWDVHQLSNYLSSTGHQIKKGTEQNKDALVDQVKSTWYETGDKASSSFESVKDWIFDSWTDSHLKAFLDKHGIPAPQPRTRDSLLKAARENYQTAAKKANDASSYPGNWLWDSWSDSDLKAWLDARGIPVPQHGNRDKMIAAARRNSRTAALNAKYLADEAASSISSGATQAASSASSAGKKGASSVSSAGKKGASSVSSVLGWGASSVSSAAGGIASSLSSGAEAAASGISSGVYDAASSVSSGASVVSSGASSAASGLTDQILSAWSDSDFKAFFDKNGIKVPQGSNRNELLALARKHSAKWTGDNLSDSATSAYHAATSSAGNQYAKATDVAGQKANQLGSSLYDQAMYYFYQAQVALGLRTNYASSASRSAASATKSVSSAYSSIKNEL